MGIQTKINAEYQQATIAIDGHFDFSMVETFRKSYQDLKGMAITLDFRNAQYMDSAGLGMLLNMQKYLGAATGGIRIINCKPSLKKVLLISRFDQKFAIE